MALECVNEEFQHFFIVDTPPSTPVKKKKSKLLASLASLILNIKIYVLYK